MLVQWIFFIPQPPWFVSPKDNFGPCFWAVITDHVHYWFIWCVDYFLILYCLKFNFQFRIYFKTLRYTVHIIYDKEKKQIFLIEKLKTENFWQSISKYNSNNNCSSAIHYVIKCGASKRAGIMENKTNPKTKKLLWDGLGWWCGTFYTGTKVNSFSVVFLVYLNFEIPVSEVRRVVLDKPSCKHCFFLLHSSIHLC